MEVKHKECFIPNIINYWGLQGVSKYAREAAEFVNLYSKSRGINRFPALVEALEWTQQAARGQGPRRQDRHSAVAARLDETRDEAGQSGVGKGGARDGRSRSEAHAGLVEGRQRDDRRVVRGVPPFPFVRECLEKLQPQADVFVVSATPQRSARTASGKSTTWRSTCVAICGQEIGTKKESLGATRKVSGRTTR